MCHNYQPPHPTWFGHSNNIYSLCDFLHCHYFIHGRHKYVLQHHSLNHCKMKIRQVSGTGGPSSSVGIATGYGLDGPGIESQWGQIFRTCPDRP
jgi:hypothetical protein